MRRLLGDVRCRGAVWQTRAVPKWQLSGPVFWTFSRSAASDIEFVNDAPLGEAREAEYGPSRSDTGLCVNVAI